MSKATNPNDTPKPSDDPNHIVNTEFWNELMHDVYGPRKGGAIIFVDAENARKGVAKTSGAVALARLLATAFGYDIQKEDMTLAGADYLRRYQEQPGSEQPSVLVLDEFVGAGAGDKRRSMSNQNLDFGRAWQLLRTKRVITLATLPDWNEADKRLKKLADYRVWMRERPIGTFQGYKITVPFNSIGGSVIKLKGFGTGGSTRRIQFPNMDSNNDPYYKHLSKKKDELIHSDTWDADNIAGEDEELTQEEVEKKEAIKFAIRLYEPWREDVDKSYRDVAEVLDSFSHAWVGERVREWKNGEHRNLVPDPTEG
jgi:hypothetical protein